MRLPKLHWNLRTMHDSTLVSAKLPKLMHAALAACLILRLGDYGPMLANVGA